jgi:prephenate dehydrogenase
MLFNHIAIVGVGLIGGSFALAAKKAQLAERITGCGGSRSLETALARGIIDGFEASFDEGRASDADLIFLAAPVGAIIDFLRRRGGQIKPGAIVTDAGSTKARICEAARGSLSEGAHFVGGHPLAGSQNSGVEFADADLFNGASYAIIVDDMALTCEHQQFGPIARVTQMVKAIGSRPVMITAQLHDQVVARTSHAPQLVSTALALAVGRAALGKALALSGGGLADMTRLAASDWSVWEEICRTNADEIAGALKEAADEIDALRAALEAGDFAALGRAFEGANRFARDFHELKRNHNDLYKEK